MDEAAALFSRRYGRNFSREEAGQAMDRLIAFFQLLETWERRKRDAVAMSGRAA